MPTVVATALRCTMRLAPDSICPKGWQLPTYSGDKSFTTLINTSYSMNNSGDPGILSGPLSFLRSGYFNWSVAGLYARGGYGYYWSQCSSSTATSGDLVFGSTALYTQYYDNRSFGFAVRRISFF